jgi:glutamate 5-kinase
VKERRALSRAKRIVVKIGSRALAEDETFGQKIARDFAVLRQEDRDLVLVSSGAIAIGCRRLGYRSRPKEMRRLQAAAAAGQSVLMRRYDEAFGANGLVTAQVLLTHADLADRERLNNAREAFAALLDAGAIPIVNENDTVSTEEIRFGDNDQLAAMVAPLVGAELLVLYTDVEGVMDKNGARIRVMSDATEIGRVKQRGEPVGTGGLTSKLDAAAKAQRSGADVVIASTARSLGDIVAGEDIGTFFPRMGEPLRARKHWILYTLRPRGALILDAGAVVAVRGGRSSLLPVGVLGVRGDFGPGDSVRLLDEHGAEVGRGLTRLGALDVARSAGKKGDALPGPLRAEIVHKDDLVLTQ